MKEKLKVPPEKIFTEYGVAYPNVDAAQAGANKYAQQPYRQFDTTAADKATTGLYKIFYPYMANSRVMPHEWAKEQMNMRTSNGYPEKGLAPDKRTMWQKYGARADAIAEEVWIESATLDCPSLLFNGATKYELRPVEKLAANNLRLFTGGNVFHTYRATRLFKDMNDKMVDTCWHTPSKIGINKYRGGWHKLYSRLMRNAKFPVKGFALDIKNYDARVLAQILERIKEFRIHCLCDEDRTPENILRIHNHYKDMIESIIVMPDGRLLLKKGGVPSGDLLTSSDDTFALVWAYLYAFFMENPTATIQDWFNDVELHGYGDDQICSVRDGAKTRFSDEIVKKWLEPLGYVFTSEKPGMHPIRDLDFLSHTFGRDPNTNLVVPIPDEKKLYCSALYKVKGDAEDEEGLNEAERAFTRYTSLRLDGFYCRDFFNDITECCQRMLRQHDLRHLAHLMVPEFAIQHLYTGAELGMPTLNHSACDAAVVPRGLELSLFEGLEDQKFNHRLLQGKNPENGTFPARRHEVEVWQAKKAERQNKPLKEDTYTLPESVLFKTADFISRVVEKAKDPVPVGPQSYTDAMANFKKKGTGKGKKVTQAKIKKEVKQLVKAVVHKPKNGHVHQAAMHATGWRSVGKPMRKMVNSINTAPVRNLNERLGWGVEKFKLKKPFSAKLLDLPAGTYTEGQLMTTFKLSFDNCAALTRVLARLGEPWQKCSLFVTWSWIPQGGTNSPGDWLCAYDPNPRHDYASFAQSENYARLVTLQQHAVLRNADTIPAGMHRRGISIPIKAFAKNIYTHKYLATTEFPEAEPEQYMGGQFIMIAGSNFTSTGSCRVNIEMSVSFSILQDVLSDLNAGDAAAFDCSTNTLWQTTSPYTKAGHHVAPAANVNTRVNELELTVQDTSSGTAALYIPRSGFAPNMEFKERLENGYRVLCLVSGNLFFTTGAGSPLTGMTVSMLAAQRNATTTVLHFPAAYDIGATVVGTPLSGVANPWWVSLLLDYEYFLDNQGNFCNWFSFYSEGTGNPSSVTSTDFNVALMLVEPAAAAIEEKTSSLRAQIVALKAMVDEVDEKQSLKLKARPQVCVPMQIDEEDELKMPTLQRQQISMPNSATTTPRQYVVVSQDDDSSPAVAAKAAPVGSALRRVLPSW